MARRVQAGPEAKAGWKEEWSWKDAKGVWRKRVVYGTGTAKVWAESRQAPKRRRKKRTW